jgi:hypothetical protein
MLIPTTIIRGYTSRGFYFEGIDRVRQGGEKKLLKAFSRLGYIFFYCHRSHVSVRMHYLKRLIREIGTAVCPSSARRSKESSIDYARDRDEFAKPITLEMCQLFWEAQGH